MRRTTLFAGLAVLTVLLGCGDAPAPDADSEASAPTEGAAASTPAGPTEVGTLTGTLNGEDRTWTALYMVRNGNPTGTSSYQTRTVAGTETHSLSLGGHVGATLSSDGSLRVSVMATEPLDDCPCTFTNETVEYVVDLPDDVWEARQATVTIDVFYQNGDGTFGAEGSFAGTLVRTDGSSDQEMPVEGTFDVRKIMRVGEGS